MKLTEKNICFACCRAYGLNEPLEPIFPCILCRRENKFITGLEYIFATRDARKNENKSTAFKIRLFLEMLNNKIVV